MSICDRAKSRVLIDMQFTNSVVCGRSKGCIYKQIKPPLVGEHAFPLAELVCRSAHFTFGGSGGIMSTARPELPYPCNSQASLGTRLLGGGSNVTAWSQI